MSPCRAFAISLAFLLAAQAHAVPIQLNETDFANATASLSVTTEDFEGFSTGLYASPFTFSNGQMSSVSPLITASSTFCDTGQCLLDSTAQGTEEARVFSGFAADTDYWATDLRFVSPADLFDVVVTGNSGVLNLNGVSLVTMANLGFVGFYDPLGLLSISFTNLGTQGGLGNYSFDNIQTASEVPEPATILLLGAGLMGLSALRRRRISK
ncbi:MAG: PEP-CTERM sorting domain-containing protein [Woeseiaceae bacterium]|nr:PEP-CTERM sorting domain-containing protein [Woeseiaceae bacterium]